MLQGRVSKLKISNLSIWVILCLVECTSAFLKPVMAARVSENLRVSAVILSVCRIDNSSLNFIEPQMTNPDKFNSKDAEDLTPLSVTCNNKGYEETHSLAYLPKTLHYDAINTSAVSTDQNIVTVYYN
jgi:hypothetical protein